MLGGWSISQELIDWIRENVPRGSVILELGSGYGTQVLADLGYSMYSVEHDPQYVGKYDSLYIPVPIKNGWYNPDSLRKLPTYDLLLIDGPPGIYQRSNMIKHRHLFDWSKIVIVDDTNRADELKLSKWVGMKKNAQPIRIDAGEKQSHVYR